MLQGAAGPSQEGAAQRLIGWMVNPTMLAQIVTRGVLFVEMENPAEG